MFSKVLIANRGEIALRVIRACRELGLKSVAVHSQRDANALHVRVADEAVCIGPPPAKRSYLNIPSLLAAAEVTGAQAIHPGYGFLSENPDFAEIVERSGLCFIGPRPPQMRVMGSKLLARARMRELGLPVLPGSDALKNAADAAVAADEIGYPVILKASAGGGGRGMRIVTAAAEMATLFQLAQNESKAAFGSDEIYVEKLLVKPRHIEFQILGDGYGRAIHLGERECSVQRRHQKLVEEALSPNLDPETRSRMGGQCASAVAEMEYRGAGTLEFLQDSQTGAFYFLEMNTRIQVEHPVTEIVSGVDLVRAQLQVAAEDGWWITQEEVTLGGHAIECRINAEDPERMLPSPGRISTYDAPGGPGIRLDSAAFAGWMVPPEYDSLVSKLIAYGPDRATARARMSRALDEYVIEGIQTNISLHRRILSHPDFVRGQYDTDLIERL